MTNLEAFTLFTSGVRLTVLSLLIWVLAATISSAVKKSEDIATKVAHNPKIMLGLILTLLTTSLVELSIELYDHWSRVP